MTVYKKISKKWVPIRNIALKSKPTILQSETKSFDKSYSGSSFQVKDEDKIFLCSNFRNILTKPYYAFDGNYNTYWEPGIPEEGKWVYSNSEGGYVFIPNISEEEYIMVKLDNSNFNLKTLKIICNFDNVEDQNIVLSVLGSNDIFNFENIATIYLDPINELQSFEIEKLIKYEYLRFEFKGRYSKDIKVNQIELYNENGKVNLINKDRELSFYDAFNGEFGLYWSGRLGNIEEYIEVDLGKAEEINQLSVYLTDNKPKNFILLGSNDMKTYNTILVGKFDNNKGLQDFIFTNSTYRYFKLKLTSKYEDYYKINKIFLNKVETNRIWNRFCDLWLKVNGRWVKCTEYIFTGLINEYIDINLTDATINLIPLNKVDLFERDIHLIETYINSNISFLFASKSNKFIYAKNINNGFGDYGFIIETEILNNIYGEVSINDFSIKDEKNNIFLVNSIEVNKNKLIINTSNINDAKGKITISYIGTSLKNEAEISFDPFSISFTPVGLVPTIRETPRVEVIWNE